MHRYLALLVFGLRFSYAADAHTEVIRVVDENAPSFRDTSRQIWQFAESGFHEDKSSRLLQQQLKNAGFQVTAGVADMPTAFVASYGSGKPVIGILGEFDALPGLSQDAAPERRILLANAPGHACGHNLLGAGGALAAISIKQYLEKNKIPGTVRFYGAPAEEGGSGKVYLVRAGLFKDVDVVLHWHPGDVNAVMNGGTIAMISAKFQFHGQAAHASAAPDRGRSALDGLMIMDTSVEYLREHVPSSTRIHYIITKGGVAPNVVPDFAEGFLYARHPSMTELNGIFARVVKCAQAGALASETTMDYHIVNSDYDIIPNLPLAELIHKNLEQVGPPKYTPAEKEFAVKLMHQLPPGSKAELASAEKIAPLKEPDMTSATGSSDVGDISWVVPTIGVTTAAWAPGTPAHSWQAVACSGSSIGQNGMVVAAKVLAVTAQDLFTNPAIIQEAKDDLKKRLEGQSYHSNIPAGQKPPLDYRKIE